MLYLVVLALTIVWWICLRRTTRPTGAEFMRQCTPDERTLLTRIHELSTPTSTPIPDARLQWVNVFVDGQYLVDLGDQQTMFDTWVRQLAKEAYPHFNPRVILSVSFITSPANGIHTQNWHVDYKGTEAHIFISLTPVTTDNATQYMDICAEPHMTLLQQQLVETSFPNLFSILDILHRDSVVIKQLVYRPFCITKMHRGTVHRGIANRGTTDRVMLCIVVDECLYPIYEKVYNTAQSDQAIGTPVNTTSSHRSTHYGTTVWDTIPNDTTKSE